MMRIFLAATVLSIAYAAASAQDSGDRTFGGNDCTEDCSGHKAGYEWAQENGISDENACGGNSNSFIEGCQTFVQEPARGADEDDDGNEIAE